VLAAQNMNKSHYDILQVARDASQDVIRAARNRLVKKWHPDHNPKNLPECEDKMKEINEAHEVLSDPERRKAYDKTLRDKSLHLMAQAPKMDPSTKCRVPDCGSAAMPASNFCARHVYRKRSFRL
jgi:DnaJ-class molecular chaperone